MIGTQRQCILEVLLKGCHDPLEALGRRAIVFFSCGGGEVGRGYHIVLKGVASTGEPIVRETKVRRFFEATLNCVGSCSLPLLEAV